MGILVTIGAGLALALLVYDRIQRAKTRRDEPTCGKCGYCVRGIASLICPECGSDLREVGILGPVRLPNPGLRLFTHLLIWTLLVLPPGIYALDGISDDILPLRSEGTRIAQILCNTGYFSLTVRASFEGQSVGFGEARTIRFDTLILYIPQNPGKSLWVDLPSGRILFQASKDRVPGESSKFDTSTFERWLADVGISLNDDPMVHERINEVMQILKAMIDGDTSTLRKFSPAQTKSVPLAARRQLPGAPATFPSATVIWTPVNIRTEYTGWTYLCLIGIPVVIWIAGNFWLIRRARRQQAGIPAPA